jgi:hypothetical protein
MLSYNQVKGMRFPSKIENKKIGEQRNDEKNS